MQDASAAEMCRFGTVCGRQTRVREMLEALQGCNSGRSKTGLGDSDSSWLRVRNIRTARRSVQPGEGIGGYAGQAGCELEQWMGEND